MQTSQAPEKWDLTIKPQNSLFNLHLQDVWRYRDLLLLLVRRDFVSFYKQTILGPLWFFIQPLFTTLMYVFIFGNLAGFSTDGLPQPLFYMTGIIAWNYFADCLTKTSTVFKDNANIFGKVYFPRLIMPISIVLSSLVRLGVQFILLLLTMCYFALFKNYHFAWSVYLFLLPVFILLLAILGLGLGMLFSALTTKYRDLAFLLTFGVQLLMYATPIIYSLDGAAEKFKDIIQYNPLTSIIEGVRLGLLGKGTVTNFGILYTLFFTFLSLIVGVVIFNKVEKTFVDTV